VNRLVVSLALVACVAFLAAAPRAVAAAPGRGTYLVEIHAVPGLAGLRFVLDGQTVATRGGGVARIYVSRPGTYRLRATAAQESASGKRVRFSRWMDSVFEPTRSVNVRSPRTVLAVGFTVEYPVQLKFVDLKGRPIDSAQITSVTLTNSLGQSETFRGADARRWLLGSRVSRLVHGLNETEIQYGVDRVMVDGSNVVNTSQQRFYPARGDVIVIQLLFYSAHVSARDAFFGFPVGSAIQLVYPSGKVERYELGSGSQTTLQALPRGEYRISVDGPGMSFSRPLALSKDQEVNLEILSYLDVAVVLAFLTFLGFGLVLIGRPHLRHALRGRLTPPSASVKGSNVLQSRARSERRELAATERGHGDLRRGRRRRTEPESAGAPHPYVSSGFVVSSRPASQLPRRTTSTSAPSGTAPASWLRTTTATGRVLFGWILLGRVLFGWILFGGILFRWVLFRGEDD